MQGSRGCARQHHPPLRHQHQGGSSAWLSRVAGEPQTLRGRGPVFKRAVPRHARSMPCGGCAHLDSSPSPDGRQPTYFIHGEVSDQNLRPSHGPDRPLLPRRRDRDRLCPTHAAIIDSSFGRKFDGLRYLYREGSKLGRPWSLRGYVGFRVPYRRGWERISRQPLEPCDAVRNTATGTDLKSSPTESEALSAV